MRIAISAWLERVSPVCDVAEHFVIVDRANGMEERRGTVSVEERGISSRVETLRRYGVEFLLCGAISQLLESALTAAGIRVIAYLCGPVDAVLRAYIDGKLEECRFAMPGYQIRKLHRKAGGTEEDGPE